MSPNAKLKWLLGLVGIPILTLIPASCGMFWLTYFFQWMNWFKWNTGRTGQPIALVHALSLVVAICLDVVGHSGGTGFLWGEAVLNRVPGFFFTQAFLLYIDLYVAKNIGAGLTSSVTRFAPTQFLLSRRATTSDIVGSFGISILMGMAYFVLFQWSH